MFLVPCLEKEAELNIMGRKQDIPLQWGDGMVGVCPVFETQEDAEQYAGSNYKIAEIKVGNKSKL